MKRAYKKQLHFEIRNDSLIPKYQQIVDGIIEAINQKKLNEGDILPSVRFLCREFSLSQDTVFKAYVELKKRGIVEAVTNKGYFVSSASLSFEQKDEQEYIPETDPLVKKKLEEWQDIKFGLMMHWGIYSLWGVVESWSLCSEDLPWCKRHIKDYEEYKREYKELIKVFNPVKFDPQKWAKAAKNAGMKYLVFTTKHHDGFCMFQTKLTDNKITSDRCPFHTNPKADVTKAVFDAFRDEGFMIGVYFSKPDWNSEYYWWPYFATADRHVNYNPALYPKRWQKFKDFTYGQIKELMTGYGKIDILWLDGAWVRPIDNMPKDYEEWAMKNNHNQDIDMQKVVNMARKHQPGLIMVDRWVNGKFENYISHELRIPGRTLEFPWESCIAIAEGFSYVPDQTYKTVRELIQMLVQIVVKGGNLLLNIGVTPKGTWSTEAYTRLEGIGNWMQINGEAIYHTRPFVKGSNGKINLVQHENKNIYAFYIADENESNPPSEILMESIQPANNATITMLGVKKELEWQRMARGIKVLVPESIQKRPPCKYVWTLKIVE